MDVRSARDLFPATRNLVYLNHAASSPSPVPVRDAMIGIVHELSSGGFLVGPKIAKMRDSVARRAAELVNGEPESVAVVHNTTHGIRLAAEGLPWREGDNVVCANVEFPANVYPWLSLKSRGVKTRFAREVDARVPIGEVGALVDERTRVVALSFVEFTNGYRNDLVALGELCRQSGALFVVDAIQGLGALSLDVKEARIDLMSSGGHKWLAGPMGVGIAVLSERAMEEITPPFTGWLGVRRPLDFLNYDQQLAPDAHKFDEGSPNLVGLWGLEAALALILEIGIEAIEARVKELTDLLVAGLEELECEVASPRGPNEWSGIVSFKPPAGTAGELQKHLCERQIITSLRGDLIRAGCHYWNDESDVEASVAAVEEWSGTLLA